MLNPKLRFFFREPKIDTNLALVDGTVTVEGFDLEVADGEWDAIDHRLALRLKPMNAETRE